MSNLSAGGPFAKRFTMRVLITIGLSLLLSPIGGSILVPIAAILYFKKHKKKGMTSCSDIIGKEFGEDVRYIEEVFHDNKEWGFLAITTSSLIYIPKEGNHTQISFEQVENFGSDMLGTGEFTTTFTNLPNTNVGVGTTRENKSPIFYVFNKDGTSDYWHTLKNNEFFKAIQLECGVVEDRKVNY